MSERIRVRSVVGRLLEHSRVYWFANGGRDDLYLGSADLMERNLNRRVEAVCRVRDEGIVRHIRDVVLDAYLRDSDSAFVLTGNRYEPAASDPAARVNAQQELLAWYTARPAAAEAVESCGPERPALPTGDVVGRDVVRRVSQPGSSTNRRSQEARSQIRRTSLPRTPAGAAGSHRETNRHAAIGFVSGVRVRPSAPLRGARRVLRGYVALALPPESRPSAWTRVRHHSESHQNEYRSEHWIVRGPA